MTFIPSRPLAVSVLVVVAAVSGACGSVAEDPVPTTSAVAEQAAPPPSETHAADHADTRTEKEQAFLADLSGFGLPTEMTAVTTIEVGVGICDGIDDGADTETILDRIRPLTSAIAAQSADLDSAGVGRAILDASRTHLCD